MGLIHEVIAEIMGDDTGLDLTVSPAVIMVIGVNGAGKTTTIGKLCHQFRQEGKKVLVAAADTFRAEIRRSPFLEAVLPQSHGIT